MSFDRALLLLTGPYTHLDHLHVFGELLHIPIVVTDPQLALLSQIFYPHVSAIYRSSALFSLDFFVQDVDLLIESGRLHKMEMDPFLRMLYGKQLRYAYCPHGNSDKGHSSKVHPEQDVVFFYGEEMRMHLLNIGAWQYIRHPIRMGNLRRASYERNRQYYTSLVQEHILSHIDQNKPIALFAPTWQDGENPSSFFKEMHRVCTELSSFYTVIVKLHPLLETFHYQEVLCAQRLYANKVLFLEHWPAIYPLIELCDIYIGDYSSMGYDFLSVNRPLYFFTGDRVQECSLHTSGMIIPKDVHLGHYIIDTKEDNQRIYEESRKSLYMHAFGNDVDPILLRRELKEATLE